MKRIALTLAILTAALTLRAGTLTPDTFTLTWTRQGVSALVNTNVYLSGVSYLLTNCQALVGTATQDLTSCGIIVRVGEASTNVAFTGTVTDAINGLFSCLVYIPARPASQARAPVMPTGIQLTITNGSVTVTDREIKQLNYSIPLQ